MKKMKKRDAMNELKKRNTRNDRDTMETMAHRDNMKKMTHMTSMKNRKKMEKRAAKTTFAAPWLSQCYSVFFKRIPKSPSELERNKGTSCSGRSIQAVSP